MKVYWKIFLTALLLVVFASIAMAQDYERSETMIVSGAMWGPPANWNPLSPTVSKGTKGLVYEYLFMYNPLKNEYRPYLAESGEWASSNVYVVKLRKGLKWNDGKDLTAEDVAFSYELARDNALTYSPIWDWLASVEVVDDYTLSFIFSEPRYEEWNGELYQREIIPKHIWSEVPGDELMTLTNRNPVGSGPY